MIIRDQAEVTDAVLTVMERTADPRLREIMVSLARHLHAFVREVRLTEEEFREATAILNEMGKLTTDTHNEPVLMAGSLGVSSLVCLLNNGDRGNTETTQSLLGPFWRMHSPRVPNGGSTVRSDTPGPTMFVSFRIEDQEGRPIEGAEVDIWHSSPVGLYENQDPEQADYNLRGKFTTDADGRLRFRSVKPAGYPVPTDGPVGDLLRAQRRHQYRPAHLHFLAFRPGYKTLITQVFVDDDQYLESDVVFGVTRHLVGHYRRVESGEPPAPDVAAPWYLLDYAFVMEPGEAKLPTPPIR